MPFLENESQRVISANTKLCHVSTLKEGETGFDLLVSLLLSLYIVCMFVFVLIKYLLLFQVYNY